MYITEVLTKTQKGEISHRCILLRESYREGGKVKNRTVANLTHSNPNEVAAMRLALAHKDDLRVLKSVDDVELQQGKSMGASWLVYEVARRLGIKEALGGGREGKLGLWQVMARVMDQGSRLSAVRLAQVHAACDILGMRQGFDEEDLYQNLGWLSEQQGAIEKRLFRARRGGKKAELFLYDVTSSYFEGQQNAMACWGYSRDKKSGKKQVVVGLLCDEEGDPVSVEVFTGNTQDYETFGSQVQKAGEQFGCKRVTWVGDRGMIKRAQIKVLQEAQFHYITAITKPQIEKLLRTGIFQMELFDEEVCEVVDEGVRYLLRRNPKRVEEIVGNREGKKKTIEGLCQKKNAYLLEHPRAQVTPALNEVRGKMERLKVDRWLKVETDGRRLELKEDAEALAEEGRLDGCYVVKSDLPPQIDKQTIHDRYKDLAEVEQAFRTCKTGLLQMRPWYVQLEKSTRGHALVVMLAYLITHALQQAWANFDLTVEEGLKELSTLCSMEMRMKGQGPCHRIPIPRQTSAQLLQAASVRLPHVLPYLGATVVSRKKLPARRKTH